MEITKEYISSRITINATSNLKISCNVVKGMSEAQS